jgi:GT2 family glycosyltransferase
MLSQVAKSVLGVDIDGPTVSAASAKYLSSNLRFTQGSCSAIPAPDSSVDLVVSFETIEHIAAQEGFLEEVLRVLRPDGMLLISSPERDAYQQTRGSSANEFHEKELSLSELDAQLKKRFANVQLSRQLPLFGSFVASFDGVSSSHQVRVMSLGDGTIECADVLTRGPYVIGLCSRSEVVKKLPASLFDPQLPSNLLSALEGGIRERDDQRRADSAQISELLGIIRLQTEQRRIRNDALARASVSQEKLTSSALASLIEVDEQAGASQSSPSCKQILRGLKKDLAAVSFLRHRPEFDVSYYSPRLQHFKGGRLLSIFHYQMVGWRMGRKPNAAFDTVWYNAFHKDVGRSYCSPLVHYLKHGVHEGRATSAEDEERRSREELAHRVQTLRTRLTQISGMPDGLDAICSDVVMLREAMSRDVETNSGMSPGEVLREISLINLDILKAQSLRAPYDDNPDISVVIPVYNQLRSTLACIRSLIQHHSTRAFEIIVVDDCSNDTTVAVCQCIPHIRLVTKERNSGFIDSCNRGAQVARGKQVVFLNNDTYVLPKWLDNLADTFESSPSIGLVGSQLLYPDGSLQEAGGIIWRNGQAWNYGRNQDASRGEFNYLRDVDFCSGASIMIDRDFFLTLGGFDSHYAPAYCEDVDLAFKVRERGLRVVYQPFSRLIHFEGVSSGTDVRVGVKSYQVANLQKLKVRWASALTQHALHGETLPEVARDFKVKGRVFFVDALTPTPDQDAGSIVADTWLRALVELGYHVTFFAYWNPGYIPHYTERLQRMGVHVLIPPSSLDLDSYVAQFGATYDLIIGLRHGSTRPVYDAFDKHGFKPKKVFLPIDLHYIRELRQSELTGSAGERERALETKQSELSVIGESAITLVHSSFELDDLAKESPSSDVRVSPIITDVMGCKASFEARKDICFVGGFQHTPNVDAVMFFVNEVLPLVVEKIPDVVLKVIGSKVPPEIEQLRGPNVEILGFVPDLDPIWSSIRISVAPLRFGAGVKGKVCMSLSYGVPVVCTPVAAEGMGLRDGHEVLIGSTPRELADQVLRVYQDEQLWKDLSTNGMRLVEEEFSTATNRARIQQYLADVGLGETPRRSTAA